MLAEHTNSLETPISDALFCAVDVETSSLHMSARIVEVGAVKFNLSSDCSEFQSLVNPHEPISPAATDIHGITDNMVTNAPGSPEVISRLLGFFSGCVFIAHNARFDVRMIGNELARMGADLPEVPVVCTISLARRMIKGLPSYRLESLVNHLCIDVGCAHNALPDANAAMFVFLAGMAGVPAESSTGEIPGILGPFDSVAPPNIGLIESTGDIHELIAAAESRLTIEMEYEPSREIGPVVVTAHRVIERNGQGYLRAYCHRDGVTKTYRLERIKSFWRI